MRSKYYRKAGFSRGGKLRRTARRGRRKVGRRSPLRFLVVLGLVVALGFGLSKLSWASFLTPLSVVSNILNQSGLETTDGRTNFLVLGVDTRLGSASGSATLTDTIIFASISQKDKNVKVISLPRDLWVPLGDGWSGKINAAYSVGGGVEAAKAVVEKVLGVPIHYYVLIGFKGFEEAIDILGGVMVDVKQAFDDYYYPIPGMEEAWCPEEENLSKATPLGEDQLSELGEKEGDASEAIGEERNAVREEGGTGGEEAQPEAPGAADKEEERTHPCRWQHVHFDAGPQIMDGVTALQFVRSRHALGPEGGDFARARRQQQLLMAVKDKVLSLEVFSSPSKLKELYEAYRNTVETNVGLLQTEQLLRWARGLHDEDIQAFVLDDGRGNAPRLLVAPQDRSLYGGAYVLVPRAGDFSQVHAFVQKILFGEE